MDVVHPPAGKLPFLNVSSLFEIYICVKLHISILLEASFIKDFAPSWFKKENASAWGDAKLTLFYLTFFCKHFYIFYFHRTLYTNISICIFVPLIVLLWPATARRWVYIMLKEGKIKTFFCNLCGVAQIYSHYN